MKKILLTGLLLAVCATFALAQTTTGSIYGTVKTADGLVIPDVKVSLSAEHAATITSMTSQRGVFRFGELPIGTFTLTFEKDGYQKIVLEGVVVRIAAASRVDMTLEASAAEQVITITGETAVVDLKKTGTATNLSQDYLANIPSARDPWVIMDQVAGINVDRVNVGGSESGQQSNFVSKGDDGDNAMWNVDGITITDQSSMSSPGYYDYDSFEEMQITTSGADASIQTAGVALNFITKQGSDTLHGQGSAYYTGESLQGENVPSDLEALGYAGNQIDSIKDYGFDVGGPIWKGNLWFWGAYRMQNISMLAITGMVDATELKNYNLKFTGQAGDRNRWTFFYTRGEKIKTGRNAAWNRPPETTHDQGGPTILYKVEDTFLATDDLILSGKFAYVDSGFFLMPQGGDAIPFREDSTYMYGGSSWYYDTKRPEYQLTVTGEQYIEEAFGGSHEIKAGFEWRKTPVTSLSGYGADMFQVLWEGEPYEVWLTGKVDAKKVAMRTSFYAMDIFNIDRWTFNIGVRYDRQWGYNQAATVAGNPVIPDIIPDLNYQGTDTVFEVSTFVPRIGATYDVFGDGKTVVRANFSIYGDQIMAGTAELVNPAGWREVDMEWTDLNGDMYPQRSELGAITWWYGLNPFDSTADPYDTGMRIETSQLPRTTEFLLGVEREVMPELSVAGTFIYRYIDKFNWRPDDAWVNDPYTLAGSVSQGGFTREYYEPTVDPAGTSALQPQPDYNRKYMGVEFQVTKRLADKWMANASFSYGDTKVYYGSDKAYTDPTNIPVLDGYSYAPETSGSGKASIFMNSKWAFKLTGLYQLPFDINISGYLSMREGFAYPIRLRSPYRNFSAGRAYAQAEPMGENHLPLLTMVDFRVEKTINVSDFGRLGIIMDVFNLLNTDTTLGKNRDGWTSSFGQVTEIVNPRIFRLGVRFQF